MAKPIRILLPSPQHLPQAAAEVVAHAKDTKVWLLEGPLGVGKTAFIQAVCHHFGVLGPVTSPTFTLLKEYTNTHGASFYHFDFYRLTYAQEIYDIGVEDYFASGAHCFVEWADKTPVPLIPSLHVRLRFFMSEAQSRRLELCVVS